MLPRSAPLLSAAALASLLAACADERSGLTPVGPPLFSHTSSHTLSGALLGPDGTSLCNALPGGSRMLVRILSPNPPPAFIGAQNVTCPANAYSIPVDAGSHRVRVQVPGTAALGALPWRHVDGPIDVGDDGVTRDIQVFEGSALGGLATFEGEPLAGVPFTIANDFNNFFAVTFGASAADGRWEEFFGRSPAILQNDERYQAFACAALGVKAVEGPPADGFLFPTERDGFNCDLVNAPANEFSHTHTRLVVAPLPGDIGGQSAELFDQHGTGWGVQFPVPSGESPVHVPVEASHIFFGGLMIGIAPDRVLTGFNIGGEAECGAACRDLGLEATLGFTDPTPAGRKVLWQYTDTRSPEGVGLRVRQRSFDGKRPHDYVLFHFSIQNQGSSTVTFHAGFMADWDIEADAGDDLGFTEMAGKLMFQVSEAETGVHVGTLIRGDAPTSGNFFFTIADFPSVTEQVQALSGELRQESGGPTDLRYIQGIGPITLKRGKKADLWIAVVAGETRDELVANAGAADADISDRRAGAPGAESEETQHTSTASAPPGAGIGPARAWKPGSSN